jgi:hypothetical protein
MHCRGFTGRFRSLAEFHTGPTDFLAFAMVVRPALVFLVGTFGSVFGDVALREAHGLEVPHSMMPHEVPHHSSQGSEVRDEG